MPWRIISVFVALFVLANAQSDRANNYRWDARVREHPSWKLKNPSDNFIDIDLETERSSAADQAWQDQEMSGSGSGMDVTDDEDLLASGSGSGDGVPHFTDKSTSRPTVILTTTPTTPTTSTPGRRLTPCQQLHEASQHLSGNYVPDCDKNGDYAILQCHGEKKAGSCWCADLEGREIPGTALTTSIPDCVVGNNLPRCVFQLVGQMRKKVMSTFRPTCTLDGHFERRQCEGSMCYCVDPQTGDIKGGTKVFLPDRPNCDESIKPGKDDDHKHRITLFPPGPRTTPRANTDMPTKVNINLDDKGDKKDSDDDSSDSSDSNKTVDDREPVKEPSSAASMMTQPGILAAIIGGSVVLLLCAILLAMFIIYRMKKKDEGSYPLDEPKKMPNYSYQRAPEKEFYA